MEKTNGNFLGRGWSFPPSFDPMLGVNMTESEEDIYGSLQILLTTLTGERVMQPRFGCDLTEVLFEPLDTSFQTYILEKIETAILYFEPRIDIENLRFNLDPIGEGRVLIEIDFRVITTNSRFNFVFPFYKKEGTEILEFLITSPQTNN